MLHNQKGREFKRIFFWKEGLEYDEFKVTPKLYKSQLVPMN